MYCSPSTHTLTQPPTFSTNICENLKSLKLSTFEVRLVNVQLHVLPSKTLLNDNLISKHFFQNITTKIAFKKAKMYKLVQVSEKVNK